MRENKPNIAHLEVSGCLAHSKVEAINLKKLDDISKSSLVHLEFEPGSKAYTLYNQTTWKIVVSRDMVFDEKKSWSWNETRDGPSRDPRMFHMKWGEVVDDLFMTGNTLDVISEFKAGMSSKFEMSDLGRLTYYLWY